MSTNNFSYENICIVVHNDTEYYCESCELYQLNDEICKKCNNTMLDNHIEDFQENDIENWTNILSNKIKGFHSEVKRRWTKNEALILGDCTFYKGNGEHYATIYITYQSGYYAGACLDYTIEREDENNLIKTFEDKIFSKEKAIRKVLRTFGVEVVKMAQFSNGEAVYKAVKSKK